MKITELDARFMNSGGEGVSNSECNPAPVRTGVCVCMLCPCGNRDENHRLVVPFNNPLDGGPSIYDRATWQRTGDTLETLTLTPSVLRVSSCGWHGFITNGEARQC